MRYDVRDRQIKNALTLWNKAPKTPPDTCAHVKNDWYYWFKDKAREIFINSKNSTTGLNNEKSFRGKFKLDKNNLLYNIRKQGHNCRKSVQSKSMGILKRGKRAKQ